MANCSSLSKKGKILTYINAICIYLFVFLFFYYINSLTGLVYLVADMNTHFDNPLQSLTRHTLTALSLHSLVKVFNKPTHMWGHIIDWVIARPDDDIHRESTVTDSLVLNQIMIASNPTSTLSTIYRLPHTRRQQ